MAYRFDGIDDEVRFAIGALSGYTIGPFTYATLIKRTSITSRIETMMLVADSGLTWKASYRVTAANRHDFLISTNEIISTQNVNSTSPWYLLAATRSTGVIRYHIHDGTSWAHGDKTAGGPAGNTSALVGTDIIRVGINSTQAFTGDIACAGIKKSDSSDAAIETLSRTAFQPWRDFGFDWLIGFDSSLVSGGLLQDQSSAGTGDQTSIVGTSAVSDPPGWVWTSVVVPVADFTGTPLSGTASLSVAFTDSSTNAPTSWAWTFGDGGTSSSQNPSHSYTSSGTYTVTLVATNAAGSDSETKTGYIVVTEAIAYAAGGGIDIY